MKQTKAKTPAKSSKSPAKSVPAGTTTIYDKLKASCPCGSGKSYVECCGKGEMCPCGSGKTAYECCFKSPQTHPK